MEEMCAPLSISLTFSCHWLAIEATSVRKCKRKSDFLFAFPSLIRIFALDETKNNLFTEAGTGTD